ncbi:ribonuclease H-like domain-containing protein [Rhizophagus clarus]|uniref:Ribonuclease H-like domain-containing protein n=1 Tax=Rhizophagus clarus TaxID=94130 RepID=A0A8H3LHQ0_9GLOM|nr:ribonuclease H-like domain-containing protein [Rhizophagus clarus]
MPPLLSLITQYIVRSDTKVNKSNIQTFCKPCIEELGDEKGFADSLSSQASFVSGSSHKIIDCSSYYRPIDNYIVRSLSKKDTKILYIITSNYHFLWVDIIIGKPYIWKAVDISSECENYTEIIDKIEIMLTNLKKKEITVCAIVTDSAPAYAAAWCQIRISKRSITFLLCFAHQINLCVDEIFKEFTEFKTAIDYAIRLAAFLRIQIIDFLLLKMDQITLINEILEPYCKILNVLQRDNIHLFQVVHKYRITQFNNGVSSINYSEFGSVSTKELGFVACRIFSICVNAILVKRLWSCIGFLQTKRHNRLILSKALQMSKLRADITYNHHLYNSPIFVDDANETNKNTGNLNGLKNTKDDDSDVNLEAGLEQIEESLDNEDNKSN